VTVLDNATEREAALQGLLRLAGRYRGTAPGGAGGASTGELSLVPVVDGAGLLLRFAIRRPDGTRLHDEYTLIAPAEHGRLVLNRLDDAGRSCHAYALNSVRRAAGRTFWEFESQDGAPAPRIVIASEPPGSVLYAYGADPATSLHLSRLD
jgi:hypothetical protein